MSQHEQIVTQNARLTALRRRTPSQEHAGSSTSPLELAQAINAELHRADVNQTDTPDVDARWIGKLERGEFRWPSTERRAALRYVLGADTDADLGLYRPHGRSAGTTP